MYGKTLQEIKEDSLAKECPLHRDTNKMITSYTDVEVQAIPAPVKNKNRKFSKKK